MAVDPLAVTFSELILADQDCFRSEAGWEELLKLIPDKGVTESLRDLWAEDIDRSSEQKWEDLKKEVRKTTSGSSQRVFTVFLYLIPTNDALLNHRGCSQQQWKTSSYSIPTRA